MLVGDTYDYQERQIRVYNAVGNPQGGSLETGNRLTWYEGYRMEYDADGNLTRKNLAADSTVFNQRLEWNSLGQLVNTTTNGTVALYRYDGLGRWAQSESGSSGSTDYLYDGEHLLLERSPTGAVAEYTYYPGVDRPHSLRRDTSSVHYYLQDRSGNVVALMSPAPALTNRYVYDPFGNRLEGTTESVPNALQYQGRHYDPSAKLYHFRARWYDPLLERFVSEDPIGLAGGINLYTYAGNDPVNRRDPSGLDHDGGICWESGIGGGPEGTSYWDFQHNGESWHGHQVGQSWRLCQNAPDFPWGYGYDPSGGMPRGGGGVTDLAARITQTTGATRDFVRNYQHMREANTIGADRYFHAKANCQAAQRGAVGVRVATWISDAREWFDQSWPKNDPPASSVADQWANRVGRRAGMMNPQGSCSAMLRELRPNGLPPQY